MMAAAMASSKSSSLNFSSLAREGARIERTISSQALTRFAALDCSLQESVLTIPLVFAILADRPSVATAVQVEIEAPCQWCLEARPLQLEVQSSTWLAKNESQATQWLEAPGSAQEGIDDLSVVVANELDFDVLTWFEDALLLAWPAPVCTDALCSRRPAKSYGDAQEAPSKSRAAFAELKKLKKPKKLKKQ